MINTIDKQEALESIIEENLFTTQFMFELFGEEPEYDFDHDTRPDTDDARNRVMKSQILVEVKADKDSISKIEKDYNTYFNKLKSWAKAYDADYYVDSILTTDNSITFVFDVPAQEDLWEPGKYLGNQEDEDVLAENGKEIYTQDTVKVSNKKHPLYDYEGKVLSFHGEGKGKHAEVLLSNGDTEIIKVSDLKDIDSYILSLDKENLKELTETKLSAYCMDNATDKKNAMKAIDKAEGISDRTKEKAKDILVFNESWCLDDSTDQKRFYKKVFTQNWLHTNKYITGLNLSEYSTDAPDGILMGFDSDAGEMVSYKGKLISKSDLPKNIKIRKFKDGGELEEMDEDELEEYNEFVIDTIKKIALRNNGTYNYTVSKKGKSTLDFDFPTTEDKERFVKDMSDLHNGVLKFNNGGKLTTTDNEDWKISGYGSPYIDYKLGTIHKKDDGTFMVKYGVNEVPTGAKTLAEAKSQLDKYTDNKIDYNKLSESNTWGLFPEDIRTIEEEGEFEIGHWVLSKISDDEYEAVRDGLYMEVFKTLQDLVARKNKIADYEYSEEKSKENGEETFVDSKGNERLYKAANGSLLEYTEYGHSDGEKTYTRSQAIKRIKTILKDDKDILNGRSLSEISDDDIIEIGFNHYGFDYYQAANGSIIRADKSSLLKYVNFEDNWHINLLELNPNRNQNGLKYKNNNKYAVSRTSDKGKRKVYEFETLEKAENKFNDLVTESKSFSNVSKEGVTENYKAVVGAEISSYKKQLTEALEKKYNVNISDTGFDDTHIKLAMDKNESIDDVVSFIGNTYKLTPINSIKPTSTGKKSYICVIKDKAGNELGSYPVTHNDDKYIDDFLKSIGVKMRASDTRKIEEVPED